MKIARIVLTATILLSLKNTIYCAQETTAPDIIQAPRTLSHDGTRDGRFGSARDTFNNLGKDYKGPLGVSNPQPYNLGSDEQAPTRWTVFGQTISNLTEALKLTAAVKAKGVAVPTVWTKEAQQTVLQKSAEIIEADLLTTILVNKDKFKAANKQGHDLIAMVTREYTIRKKTDEMIDEDHFNEIQTLNKTIEDKTTSYNLRKIFLQTTRKGVDIATTNDLVDISKEASKIKELHNAAYPDHKITGHPFIKNTKLNSDNLAAIVEAFNAAQVKKAAHASITTESISTK